MFAPKVGNSAGKEPRRAFRTIAGVSGVLGRMMSTAAYWPNARVPWLGNFWPGLFNATQRPRTGGSISRAGCAGDRGAAPSNSAETKIAAATPSAHVGGTTPTNMSGISSSVTTRMIDHRGRSPAKIRITSPPCLLGVSLVVRQRCAVTGGSVDHEKLLHWLARFPR